jgi:precorrin isomerase
MISRVIDAMVYRRHRSPAQTCLVIGIAYTALDAVTIVVHGRVSWPEAALAVSGFVVAGVFTVVEKAAKPRAR